MKRRRECRLQNRHVTHAERQPSRVNESTVQNRYSPHYYKREEKTRRAAGVTGIYFLKKEAFTGEKKRGGVQVPTWDKGEDSRRAKPETLDWVKNEKDGTGRQTTRRKKDEGKMELDKFGGNHQTSKINSNTTTEECQQGIHQRRTPPLVRRGDFHSSRLRRI